MDLLKEFHSYLLSQQKISKVTVKNYLADVKQFIAWYEGYSKRRFNPRSITKETLTLFKEQKQQQVHNQDQQALSLRSLDRHFSSLRKFFNYLQSEKKLVTNPFEPERQEKPIDYWHITTFKDFLYSEKISDLTIKNYIIDVKQFLSWVAKVHYSTDPWSIKQSEVFTKITPLLLNEYKNRMQFEAKLSPISINRKLSSLRKFFNWAQKQALLTHSPFVENLSSPINSDQTISENTNTLPFTQAPLPSSNENLATKHYSWFPPFRLMQRTSDIFLVLFDKTIITSLQIAFDQVEYKWKKYTNSPLFQSNLTSQSLQQSSGLIANSTPLSSGKTQLDYLITRERINRKTGGIFHIPASFFAPLPISLAHLSWQKQCIYHLRFTRPYWYKRYHSYPIVHYFHFGLLIVCLSIFGVAFFSSFTNHSQEKAFASLAYDQNQTFSFSGQLTDPQGRPLTQSSQVRFALYNDASASGAAMLWQEVQTIQPSQNGYFTVNLGQQEPISELLNLQQSLYLGVTIGTEKELTPRQILPTAGLAHDAQFFHGLLPITQSNSTKNVILTLDSVGNLTIGDHSNPVFQATDGQFTFSGQSLILTTNAGSSGDIILSPDNSGDIDIQKPIHNTTNYSNISGITQAVGINGTLSILATSSAQTALIINQNATGDLISASTSGVAKFSLDYTGSGTFANNLTINGDTLSSSTPIFNFLPSIVDTINIGNQAGLVTIGSSSGTFILQSASAQMRGNLEIDGNSGISVTANGAGLSFSGNNDHLISASAGTLKLGTVTLTGTMNISSQNSIIPSDTSSNLGSATNHFGTLYVDNIIGPSLPGSFWTTSNNTIYPQDVSNDLLIGGNTAESATIQLIASAGLIKAQNATISNSLGIGTTTPTYALDTQTNNPASAAAQIFNTDTGSNASGLVIKLGFIGSGTPVSEATSGNSFIKFLNGNGVAQGAIDSNGSNGVVFQTGGADYAEYFKISNAQDSRAMKPGTLACLSSDGGVLACGNNSTTIVGVISNQAGFVGGANHQADPDYVLVGLMGQLPINVSQVSGTINTSDPLTVASNGQVQKASLAGEIVGHALEAYNPQTDKKSTIMVAISPTWYDPTVILSGNGVLTDQDGTVIAFSPSSSNTTGNISLQTIVNGIIDATNITAQNITVLSTLITQNIQAHNIIATETIVSPITKSQQIYTDVISPLTTNTIQVKGNVVISQDASSSANEPMLSVQGNASISGQIVASSSQVQNATVSGILHAGKIIADEIETTHPSASTSATYITNVTNIYQASSSADATPQPTATATSSAQQDVQPSLPSSLDTASLTASLQTDFLQVNNGLLAFGPSSFSDVSVAGELSLNNELVLKDNTINALSGNLEIQPLRQGDLSVMAGLFTIDTDGNMKVAGTADFAKDVSVHGTLAAGVISPLSEQNLTIALNTNDTTNNSMFVINNASQSGVLTVNQLGDVIASGSGAFGALVSKGVSIVRTVQADTSITETEASASAGTATITIGQTQRTIISPFVTAQSLIYLSPTSDTGGLTPYIARQTAEDQATSSKGSFTIQIPQIAKKTITLNWWIIN